MDKRKRSALPPPSPAISRFSCSLLGQYQLLNPHCWKSRSFDFFDVIIMASRSSSRLSLYGYFLGSRSSMSFCSLGHDFLRLFTRSHAIFGFDPSCGFLWFSRESLCLFSNHLVIFLHGNDGRWWGCRSRFLLEFVSSFGFLRVLSRFFIF